MRTAIGGGTARFEIEVFDSADAAVTGLVTGNFTKRLTIDGVSDATTVTVTEVANGRYTVTFTAPAVTSGNVKYVRCWLLHATYAPRGWAEDFEVYNVNVLSGVAQTGDNYARLGAPAGASVSADVAAVKVDTAAILVDTGTTLDGRIPAALVGGRIDASVGAIATDAIAAAGISAAAANKVADHVIRRSAATAAASADGDTVGFRSALGAVRKLTNKVAVVGTDLKIYEENDTTVAGTQAITESSTANPIVGIDTT